MTGMNLIFLISLGLALSVTFCLLIWQMLARVATLRQIVLLWAAFAWNLGWSLYFSAVWLRLVI